MNSPLRPLSVTPGCSLYELPRNQAPSRVIVASTPETRAICNDPFVTGTKYTRSLTHACAKILTALRNANIFTAAESETTVMHILRGGMNFGLREALTDAFAWNDHASAFISAQRARSSDDPNEWVITENAYRKLHLRGVENVLLGDVVATGTSLSYALQQLGTLGKAHGSRLSSLTFFTIGSPFSHKIIDQVSTQYRELFPGFQGATVVYLEGIFAMATKETKMSIKIDGTDLLRTDSVLAPEFIESQYENPSFPLERCTIYDAGSRAFDICEYMEDVHEYWAATLGLANSGMTFERLIAERFPELEAERFGNPSLKQIASCQLAKAER